MKLPVYLDNHATTRVDPRVVEAILPVFNENFGNPASTAHPYGWRAREAVEAARSQVAQLAGCESGEVIFTSGATESINMVLKGIARNKRWSDIHIVTCVTEHSAVLDTCDYLESQGARITRLPVNSDGTLPLETLQASLSARVDLVSIMHGNNEIGTIHPIKIIAEICKSRGSFLHVDAAQTYGKIPINFSKWGIDYLSISGHKLYAPKGVGCLLIRRQTPPLRLSPLFHGGGHERGFRSGTLNVPGIVAIGKAAELCSLEMTAESNRMEGLRNLLQSQLESSIPQLIINGTMQFRLPGNLNVSIPGIDGQNLLPALRNHFSASSGSACTSAHPKPSHVLAALGQTDELAQSSIRFGIGRFNTENEVIYAAESLASVVSQLRAEKNNSLSK